METYQIKIYKIVNDENNEIYIGSTKQSLAKRFAEHKANYKCHNKGVKSERTSSFDLFDKYGLDNCSIVLIEQYDVTSREQQLKYERKHYDELKKHIVNKVKPHRSQKEYIKYSNEASKKQRETNKDAIKEYKQKYYVQNKEALNEEKRERYQDDEEYQSAAKKRAKSYSENNTDKINAIRHAKHNCPCGGQYTHQHKKAHLKTKKHIAYMKAKADSSSESDSDSDSDSDNDSD